MPKMLVLFFLAVVGVILPFTTAFVVMPLDVGLVVQNRPNSLLVIRQAGYVPDGMSPEEYQKFKAKESAKIANKNLGAFGPQSFKSRSLQSFQTDLEKGKTGHLLPVFNAKQKLKSGAIKPEDIPYMQRGGSWDNADVKNAKKKEWNEIDKQYAKNSANSARGGIDWTGTRQLMGGPKSQKQDAAKQKQQPEQPKKKFGWW